MDLYADLRTFADLFRADLAAKRADGLLTADDLFDLFASSIERGVALAAAYVGTPGAEKKAAVVAAVQKLYDEVIAPFDLPGVSNWIEPVVDRALGQAIPAIVGGLIELFYRKLPK